MKCPICDSELVNIIPDDNRIKYRSRSCGPADITHYAAGFSIINKQIKMHQEDFVYPPFTIYKMYENNQVEWHISCDKFGYDLTNEDFLRIFKNFEPKNEKDIMEKLEIFQTFM